MPVTVRRRGGRYRVVEAATGRVARNRAGTAVDGGGFRSRGRAMAQARAINASLHRRRSTRSRRRRKR